MSQKSSLQTVFQKAQFNQLSFFQLLSIGRCEGFQNSINRKLIWPFLIGLDYNLIKNKPIFQWKQGVPKVSAHHKQIVIDAQRSISNLKSFEFASTFYIKKKQQALTWILDYIFANNSELSYIQGFNSVAAMFVILFDDHIGYYLAEKVAKVYFYDFLVLDFPEATIEISQIIYEIIIKHDRAFKKYFAFFPKKRILGFIIPWVVTWFAQVFSSITDVFRVWDYLFSTGPHGIFYFICAIFAVSKEALCHKKSNLTEQQVHQFFQRQTKKSIYNMEELINMALEIEQNIAIQQLDAYKKLNANSMYRMENFCKQFPLFKKFHDERRKELRKNRKLSIGLKIGTIALTAAALLIFTKDKRMFKQ